MKFEINTSTCHYMFLHDFINYGDQKHFYLNNKISKNCQNLPRAYSIFNILTGRFGALCEQCNSVVEKNKISYDMILSSPDPKLIINFLKLNNILNNHAK